MSIAIPHHPVFSIFRFVQREQEPGWHIDGLGVRTNLAFADTTGWNVQFEVGAIPNFNEGYFEWIDVLSAVAEAKDKFVMIELGAGFGPWLVVAAAALRQLGSMPCQLIGVEAEPTRYKWMHEHFRTNQLDPLKHHLIQGAVHARGPSRVWFSTGDPSRTYGAAIQSRKGIPTIWSHGLRGYIRSLVDRSAKRAENKCRPEKVKVVSLSKILTKIDIVDLIDMDIQGAEYEVVAEAISLMNNKVKRVHIGTHSESIEQQLHEIFSKNGWTEIFNFGIKTKATTEFGDIKFSDGVQSWLNPRLVSK